MAGSETDLMKARESDQEVRSKYDRWYPAIVKSHRVIVRIIALVCCVLLSLAMTGWNSGRDKSAQRPAAGSPGNGANSTNDLAIQSSILRIEFDRNLHSRVVSLLGPNPKPLTPLSASETVTGIDTGIDRSWSDFALTSAHRETVSDAFGKGERLSLTGQSGDLRKNLSVTIYAEFPSIAVFDVEYSNQGATPLKIQSWSNNQYLLTSLPAVSGPAFWSYQSGSYEKRPNWVLPLRVGFKQENYLGMNASDYGGGTPIVDVWRKDVGLAVGHIEPGPAPDISSVSMPDARHARVAVHAKRDRILAPEKVSILCTHLSPYIREITFERSLNTAASWCDRDFKWLRHPTVLSGRFGAPGAMAVP